MSWSERARGRLNEAGFRAGAARRQVIELLEGEHCAVTALEIDRRLPSVGRASVYRTLEKLEQLDLVHRVEVGGESAAYERNDPGEHHHHMVCVRCGRLVPFEDASLERAIHRVGEGAEFEVISHDVLLRGVCPRCQGGS
ncbi:MAG TPA: Fur family transcriptional regulator [Solirubrobacterales bacterium]|jgi:Fur family ferric uptake transcriptional regulator|nr:Fur family transcriptional regulator [Solirubrobacterales bacterium]